MKVRVEFTVETEDFGVEEFEKEIKALIEDADPEATVLSFGICEAEEKR